MEVPNSVVVSTSTRLAIDDWCGFGDIGDICFERKGKTEDGRVFTNACKREFIKGNYNVHIVKYDSCEYCDGRVAVVCEEHVDPLKIHHLLEKSNTGEDFKNSNYMNRYDWMEYRNWGHNRFDKYGKKFEKFMRKHFQNDCGSFVFFVDDTKIETIKHVKFNINRENDWVFSLTETEHNKPIGFIIDAHASGLACGDWHYGCVFIDKATGKCFAFVFETHYTMATHCTWPKEWTIDVQADNYTYDLKQFLK